MATLLTKSTNTTPASTDFTYVLDDPSGTPADTKSTLGNIVTKAHGLSDGMVEVSGGVMSVATAGTDYTSPTGTESLSNKTIDNTNTVTVKDANLTIQDDVDTTKQAKFQASGITAGQTRTYTLPDASDTLVGLSTTDTLANKTLTTPTIASLVNANHTHQNAAGGGTLDAAAIAAGTIGTARLGSGSATSSTYLRGDQTWATVPAGGQTLVDIIVAPSGGDYTTLGAALTAATSGQTIFVRSGTYVESAITIATTNLTIIGESRETTIISLSTNAITLSGTGLQMFCIQFLSTTGIQTYSGTYKNFTSCTFSHAAGSGGLVFSGANGNITNCRMISTSTTGFRVIHFNCPKGNIVGNSIVCAKTSSASAQGAVEYGGDYINVSGNYHEFAAGFDVDKPAVGIANTNSALGATFTGNTVVVLATPTILLYLSGASNIGQTISGNMFYGGGFKAIQLASTYTNFSGNTVYGQTNLGTYLGISVEANGCVVSSNTVYGPGTTATAGISVASAVDNTVIANNIIYRYATGISILASTCDNTLIANNQIVDSTAGISDTGTGTNSYGNSWNLGSLINENKTHIYMKNTSGGSLSAGQVVVWKAVAGANEVTTTTTAGDNKVFGMSIDAPANNAFGRIQTLGKTTLLKADGTTDIAIGDYLSCFTTAGIVQKAAAGHTVIAIALEAFITDASTGVLDALLIPPRLI